MIEMWTFVLTVVSLVLTIIGLAITLVWKLTRVEVAIRAEAKKSSDELLAKLTEQERAHAEEMDMLRREFGETVNAIRTKVHEVETWSRDTFVRKDSFEMVIGRLEKSLEKLGDKIEERLERMAERLEHGQAAR